MKQTNQNLLEDRIRDILAECFESDHLFEKECRRYLYHIASRQEPPSSGAWRIQRERYVAFGGYIDLLLTSGSDALMIETKVWDTEKLHQYISYSKCLEAEGFRVCCIGILARKENTLRGRRHLLQAFFEHAADARILWGDLVHALEGTLVDSATLEGLRNSLNEIDSQLATTQSRPKQSNKCAVRDLALLSTQPDSCIQFFLDYVEALGAGFEYSPSQAGNSPLGMVVGRSSWGKWFGDEYAARLNLAYSAPRPSDPDIEPHFHFTVVLWNKTPCHGRINPNRVQHAARTFHAAGFPLVRNVASDWHHQELWPPPFIIPRTGFFYANAYDAPRFTLSLRGAMDLGWEDTISRLLTATTRIVSILDSMIS